MKKENHIPLSKEDQEKLYYIGKSKEMKDLKPIIAKNSPLDIDEIKEEFGNQYPDGDVTIKNLMDIANEAYNLGAKEYKAFFKNPNVRWW